MRFADFHPGQQLTLGPVHVTAEAITSFAQQWDAQWFHTDAQAAANGPFGGLIASGWHTCCMAMQLVAEHVLKDSESYASPGIEQLQWLQPVRPGDVLMLHITVRQVRRSSSRPELGILQWQWRMDNQSHTPVLAMEVTSMFKLASST